MAHAQMNDTTPHAEPPPEAIRRRLTMVLGTEFALLMGVAAIEGFWPGAGPGAAGAIGFLVLCMIAVPIAMVRLSRPLLRDMDLLAAENARLRELYGRARADSLLDGLTGLGNHRAFQEELARQLEHAGRTGSLLALILIDVDDLKRVNDERGHSSGDELLVSVGRTVTTSLRRNDRAFRVGGDEFALVLPGADIDTGLTAARRILASALNGGDPSHPTLPFSLSIGVSAYPAPSAQGSLLYRHADAALYWCKRHGRTNAAAFDPGRHGVAPDDRSIEDVSAAIGTILAQRMLRPVYQPIFSLETGQPIGYESLIRLTEGAPLADANALFAAAERVDRTVELDMACLEVVAEGAGALDAGVYLSVNLSPRTLESELFHPSELTTIFRACGHRAGPARRGADRARRGQRPRGSATQRRGLPAGRHPARRRRRRRGQRRPPAAERGPVRHRQDRPVARPGRDPARSGAGGPARAPGARRRAGTPRSSPRGSRRPSSWRPSGASGSRPARAISSAVRRAIGGSARSTSRRCSPRCGRTTRRRRRPDGLGSARGPPTAAAAVSSSGSV